MRGVWTNLVVSSSVVQFAEGGLVAVGHVSTPAEKHQSTGSVRQGAPEHLNAALLLQVTRSETCT